MSSKEFHLTVNNIEVITTASSWLKGILDVPEGK